MNLDESNLFAALGLAAPLLRVLKELDYLRPTPIQQQAISAALSGRDIMATAETGSGKTASFVLPLLQRLASGQKVRANQVRALVLVPTRELAEQVGEVVVRFRRYLPLKSCIVFGGVKINPQMMKLRGGTDLLIATPGRLLDLYRQNAVRFQQLETLVLDEADRMLGLGFGEDIQKIIALLPSRRQNLLFSATCSDAAREQIGLLLKNPLELEINPPTKVAQAVNQWVYAVDKAQKTALLSHLVHSRSWSQVLVFVSTQRDAETLAGRLRSSGLPSAALHGNQRQNQRKRNLGDFTANRCRVLVATDLAARGLDIKELPRVINFELPQVAENYIHRLGRTGRAGLVGEGISLVSAEEGKLLARIEALIQQILERRIETGFSPKQQLALTRLAPSGPKTSKKPKKPKLPFGGAKS